MTDIVTKEMLERYRAKHWILEGELTYNTIIQAVELLERATPFLGGWNGYEKIRDDIEAFLDRYHAGDKPQNNSEQNK